VDTVEFLRKIWPPTGLYIIARLTPKGFRHQVCESIQEAANYALEFDKQGVPTYHACATFQSRDVETVRPNGEVWHQVRVRKNVRSLKCFWMDLDVEPGNEKKFESQEAAIDGLIEFLGETQLPMPMVISSGGGVHIYWTLNNEIQPEAWKATAEGLKQLSAKLGFKSDPACTSDSARVLRPVGTTNRKNASVPRPVELIGESVPLDFATFNGIVLRGLSDAGIKPPEAVRQVEAKTETINQDLAVKSSFPPCSGQKVAERCAQLRAVRDTRGQVSEPHWYAAIQLLCHSVEGDALIHEWSKGYEGYTEGETNRKIAQVRGQNLGPTLCATFESRNPAGCDSCPFKGKISSPAQLGTQITSAPAPVVEVRIADKLVQLTIPVPPAPFTRGAEGGIYIEEDGITHKIYEYDLYPVELAYDEQLGYETTRWRHFLPNEGWKECVLRSSLLARPVEFESALRDNHIRPLVRGKIAMYGDYYIRKISADSKMRKLFRSQGWKENNTEFVLGDKLYRKDEVVQAGFSHGTEGFLKPFHSRGSLDAWRALTSVLDNPKFEPHAFMLLLAFAAPLLKLAGRQGFTVCALGDSGAGKSTMGMFMSSVYGHPDAGWIKRDNTQLARIQRLGAHFSLPAYMDEASTIAPKELRDLIYMIPTGKGRDSMRQDYSLREGAEWATIFVTSTNDSLQSKLQLEKANAEAEGLRLFEFRFPKAREFGPISKIIPAAVQENYGLAGEKYIEGLVNHQDAIRSKLKTVVEEAEARFQMDDKERFWSQAIALTLYGGELAREWGLIEFDPQRIVPWLQSETRRMRHNLAEGMAGSVAVLGDYLNEHIGERLTVTRLNAGLTGLNQRPMRALSQRYEKDSQLLYIGRKHLKHYMDERHYNYNEIKDDLMARGILLEADVKKVLGGGTDLTGGQVSCWKVQADHTELGALLG
jgi:hypothetical protein